MLQSIPNGGALDIAALHSTASRTQQPSAEMLEEQQAFQGFAAGTFYQTMMKALRSTERETKYFNGGRAEKIFRAELDQQVAGTMSEEHGDIFAGPLFSQHRSAMRQNAENAATKNANLSNPFNGSLTIQLGDRS